MNKLSQSVVSILLALVWGLATIAPVFGQSQDQWQAFIEAVAGQVAGELLPPGVGDVVSALENAPDIVKVNLLQWLQFKMRDTALAGDMDKLDRYQAFHTCWLQRIVATCDNCKWRGDNLPLVPSRAVPIR